MKLQAIQNTTKLLGLLLITILAFSCDPNEDDTPEPTPTIDLQADEIVFMVTPTSSYAGNATITGRVKNMEDNFVSGEGQQAIVLYERQLGEPTNQPGTEVGRVTFTTLNAGETLQVSYTRPWNSASPAEGEFAPEYILRLSLDPDIQIDGNMHNNDNNSANNEIIVSGHAINQMF